MSKQEIIRRIAAKYGQDIRNDEIKRIGQERYDVSITSQEVWNCLGPRQLRLGNGTAMQLDEARKFLRMTGKDYDVAVRVLRLATASP